MHGFVELLRHGSIDFGAYLVVLGIGAAFRAPRDRERRRTVLEADAAEWPAVDGIATCRVLPAGLNGFRLFVWAVPADGGRRTEWSRVFPVKQEADHYARALRGRTVAMHVDPYDDKERILRWDELKAAGPPFVSKTQGRLSRPDYAGAQGFRALAWGGLGLATADVAMFARNPDFMWRGMCLCELSMALLALGCLLLVPASKLRFRMKNLPHASSSGQFEGAARSVLLFLIAAAVMTWVGVLLFFGLSSKSPDWAFFSLLSAPMFPLFWWSSVVGTAAVRELRPIAPVVEAARVNSRAILTGTIDPPTPQWAGGEASFNVKSS